MFPTWNPMDNFMFKMMPFFFTATFLFVIVVFVAVGIKSLSTWMSNNRQPVLVERARVISKRTHVWSSSRHHTHHPGSVHHHSHYHRSVHTQYFITFELEDGSRHEFQVSGHDYGLIAEGDVGSLTFQGTRFKGFVPQNSQDGW
ncbi:MAG: DUF2500 domain-containing protein [Limnochordia bacterium]